MRGDNLSLLVTFYFDMDCSTINRAWKNTCLSICEASELYLSGHFFTRPMSNSYTAILNDDFFYFLTQNDFRIPGNLFQLTYPLTLGGTRHR